MDHPIDVPITGVDKSKPDVSPENLTLILAGLLIPSHETAWLLAREVDRRRTSEMMVTTNG